MIESIYTAGPSSKSAAMIPRAGEGQANLDPIIQVDRPGPWLQIHSAKGFEWTTAELPLAHLPRDLEGLRILHLSDFHARSKWDPAYDELIQRVAANPPDLILFTGDFVDHKINPGPGFPVARELVSKLKSRLGFVGILGNHDCGLTDAQLSQFNCRLADHRRFLLDVGSAAIEIIGLGGLLRLEMDLPYLKTLPQRPGNAVRIVLSHFPDHLRRTAFLRPDLYLCGHTHGGQICLPNRLPLIRHDTLPRKLCTGIHRAYGTWLLSNRGFGFSSHIQFRIFCPAEVIEIRLKSAAA
jgi:uncharacterized protein